MTLITVVSVTRVVAEVVAEAAMRGERRGPDTTKGPGTKRWRSGCRTKESLSLSIYRFWGCSVGDRKMRCIDAYVALRCSMTRKLLPIACSSSRNL